MQKSKTRVVAGWQLAAFALWTVVAGCASPGLTDDPYHGDLPPDDLATDEPLLRCVDKDGDGFGRGCGNGMDCDDSDPAIGAECYACNQNQTGCACAHEGQKIACGEVATGSDGQPGCRMGQKVCQGGVWSECRTADGWESVIRPMGLGNNASDCLNTPCDPYCQHYPDTPDDTLTDLDAGIVGKDSGIEIAPVEIDAGPPQACVNETAEAKPVPLDVYIMLDKSGSMLGSRWTAVTGALKTFVQDSSSAGVTVALDYFPQSPECNTTTYSSPSVEWQLLPGGAQTIVNSLNGTSPTGGTPTRPALEGAIEYARARQLAYPDHKVIVVLATDGQPNNCSSTVTNVAQVAAAGFAGTSGGSWTVSTVSDPYASISGSGTLAINSGDDTYSGGHNIGFNFSFFGQTYTSFWVDSNGYLTFGSSGHSSYSNTSLPSSGAPNPMVAPFWDDLTGGKVYYKTEGSAPNRRLIVQWSGYKRYGTTGNINFQAVLHENGDIVYRYGTMSGTGATGTSATIGLNGPGGSAGHMYSYNTGSVGSSRSMRFTYNGSSTSLSIPTYVIGVGSVSNLNQIAASGGGNSTAYITTSGDSSSFLAAMRAIRQSAVGCEYTLPVPSTGHLDPAATVVTYRNGSTGTPVSLPRRMSQSDCNGAAGFYYDNNTAPTKLYLCPTTCSTVSSNSNYKVDLTFKCKANCGSTSESVEPIPLDMYVMLDKSGSMAGSRWTAVTNALRTFVDTPSFAGTGIALDFFPLPEGSSAQCPVSNYTDPTVPWGTLPGHAQAFKTGLASRSPTGMTPTRPALEGAIEYARQRAIAYPNHKVIVVLATDGAPNDCSSTVQTVADAAARGFLGQTEVAATASVVSETFENIYGNGGISCGISGDDDSAGSFPIGFTFPFYGTNYTRFYADSNGWISMADNGTDYSNSSLPDTSAPRPIIAAFWDDLYVGTGVYYKTLGTAPNRRLVVQWVGTRRLGDSSGSVLNFEIVLFENGNISMRYGSLTGTNSDGRSATVGIQDASGTRAHMFSYNDGTLKNRVENKTVKYAFSTSSTSVSIPTYVIGVGYSSNLNTIASAGGTGSAFIVDGGDSSQFLAAMAAIRESALGCDYVIPSATVPHGVVDPDRLTVRYTPGNSTPVDIPLRSGAAACAGGPGFYYDDPTNPTTITLCPVSCNMVAGDNQAQLAIFYDCLPRHEDGVFTRDFTSNGLCPPGASPVWSTFSWNAVTPGTSFIDFTVATAATQAGLVTATEHPLLHTDPPGPTSLVGQRIRAQSISGLPVTTSGWAKTDTTLSVTEGLDRKAPFLRLRAKLNGNGPAYVDTPVLKAWDLAISCEASE